MRENTGVVLWVLVISFGGLWVLQDSGVFDTIGTDPLGKVIIVNGDPITREVYSRQLEAQLEQVRRSNNGNVSPQQLELERERAYNALVENSLREHVMDDIGVTVSDAEVRELILGENPHWLIRQNFSDGAGGINRALLQNVIDDPAQQPTLIQIEQFIRLSRREQRFNQLLEATARVSDADAKSAWMLQQKSANAEFFLLQYADVLDSLVTVTDRDVQRYYSDNREDYARERLYTIQIASLSRLPASEDTLAIMRELERLQQGLEEAENDSLFLAQSGSEISWSDNFRSASTLAPEIASILFEQGDAPQAGDVIGPVIVNGQAQLIKVTDTRPAEDTHVRARHILLNDKENPSAIQDIRRRIQAGEDFAAVAAQMSDDPGSGSNGGDLGWFGPGRMVAPFEEAAFGANIGTLVGPVETDFGLHLIEVNHRATVDVQLAQLAYTIDVSVATLNNIQEALEDLAYYADEEGDFVGEANRRNIDLQFLQVQDGQTSIPGFGQSFAMEAFLRDSDAGEISPVIELDDVALVVQVVDIEAAGYEPFETVEPQVRQLALLQKKRDYQVARLQDAYESGGYEGLADALGVTPQIASGVSFQSPIISGLGRDYHFVGIVLGLEAEEDSGVIEGENGTYVARVTDVFEPVEISDDELNNLKSDLSREQQTAILRDWISSLRESANIEDLRTDLLPQQ
ncbi:MAG: peptidylprolyl isomerase [Bacteroidetes bacterium]|nr:peptidylprolyl isomerase [Bacteroidota bacterium]MDE2671005.1 peptidylprolyl isomerase [Bacteroidota bacterium]